MAEYPPFLENGIEKRESFLYNKWEYEINL